MWKIEDEREIIRRNLEIIKMPFRLGPSESERDDGIWDTGWGEVKGWGVRSDFCLFGS